MTNNSSEFCGSDCSCAYAEDCVYNDPAVNETVTPDNRNADAVNKFGCAYLDCDCERPCTENVTTTVPVGTTTIIVNGSFNGDIIING